MRKRLVTLLVMNAVLLTSIAGCGSSDGQTENAGASNEESTSDSDIANDNVEQNDEDDLVFWYNQQDWGNIQGTYDGTLLTVKMQAPIDLSTIDECSAPYHWFPNGVQGRDAETISEILESDVIQRPGGDWASIWGGEEERGETDGIIKIGIYNYSEDKLPIKTCYENGWWRMKLDCDAFGISVGTEISDYEIEKADALVELLGTPTYITDDCGCFSERIAENEGGIYYQMIYEFDEYVISVDMREQIMHQYDAKVLVVEELTYYTKECWEQELDESIIINVQ